MFRPQADAEAVKILAFMTSGKKGADRLAPLALAALMGRRGSINPGDYDYHDVLDALHRLARDTQQQFVYAADLAIWTTNPLLGDGLANAIWQLRNLRTRSLTSAEDNAISASGTHYVRPRDRMEFARIEAAERAMASIVNGVLPPLETHLESVRAAERAAGLI